MTRLTRRRFLSLSASAALCTAALKAQAKTPTEMKKVTWQGRALGAETQLTLYSSDTRQAQAILELCLSETHRLEKIFSLFQRNSEIVKLNKTGWLSHPSSEMVALLKKAQAISAKTNGLFDVTVQPLWQLYRKASVQGKWPRAQEIVLTLKRIGWQNINITQDEIRFSIDQMAITLNGIAQGFITDHITRILKQAGYENILVNMGEWRSLGQHPTGRDWQILLPSTDVLSLKNMALATSSGAGLRFEGLDQVNHLFHPQSGHSPIAKQQVSVLSKTATEADALSTALSLCDQRTAQEILSHFPDASVYYA